MTPDESAPKWNKERAWDRVQKCRVMLYMHEFLTEAENRKVKDRIEKWLLQNVTSTSRG